MFKSQHIRLQLPTALHKNMRAHVVAKRLELCDGLPRRWPWRCVSTRLLAPLERPRHAEVGRRGSAPDPSAHPRQPRRPPYCQCPALQRRRQLCPHLRRRRQNHLQPPLQGRHRRRPHPRRRRPPDQRPPHTTATGGGRARVGANRLTSARRSTTATGGARSRVDTARTCRRSCSRCLFGSFRATQWRHNTTKVSRESREGRLKVSQTVAPREHFSGG